MRFSTGEHAPGAPCFLHLCHSAQTSTLHANTHSYTILTLTHIVSTIHIHSSPHTTHMNTQHACRHIHKHYISTCFITDSWWLHSIKCIYMYFWHTLVMVMQCNKLVTRCRNANHITLSVVNLDNCCIHYS